MDKETIKFYKQSLRDAIATVANQEGALADPATNEFSRAFYRREIPYNKQAVKVLTIALTLGEITT